MAYSPWSVVFNEQPSASKWNILGTNDAYFDTYIDRSGFPIQSKFNSATAVATGTTQIPADDTMPQITEGDQYMTQAITPTSATNLLVIEFTGLLAHNAAGAYNMNVALFQDATANALAATTAYGAAQNAEVQIPLTHTMVAGTTSSTTFRIRAGAAAIGTTTFNGVNAGRLFGAITKSSLVVTEYRV